MCWLGDGKDIRPVKVGCWFVDGVDLTGASHILELKLSSSTLSSLAAIKSRMDTFRVVQVSLICSYGICEVLFLTGSKNT